MSATANQFGYFHTAGSAQSTINNLTHVNDDKYVINYPRQLDSWDWSWSLTWGTVGQAVYNKAQSVANAFLCDMSGSSSLVATTVKQTGKLVLVNPASAWNPSDKTVGVTLSGSNLIATI